MQDDHLGPRTSLFLTLFTFLIVTLFTLPSFAGTVSVFGPRTFERDQGKPVTVTDSFSILNPGSEFILRVQSGRVASAVISINGSTVVGPEEFNQNLTLIEKQVTLSAFNEIAVEVRGKLGGNIFVEILGVQEVEPPILHLEEEIELGTSTRATLISESRDPEGQPLSFSWTQLEGLEVMLQFADSPNVSFITPAEDSEMVLRLTVSNGAAGTSREIAIHVVGFATHLADLGVSPGSGESHTSNLEVLSTSLRPGFVWGRNDTELEINLTASDGAVLVDLIDPIEPLGIGLLHATGAEEITDMFGYSPGDNKVSLLPSRVGDFSILLRDQPMQLLITGGDSVGNGAEIYVPLLNGRFQILGTTTLAPGATPEPLDGTLVTLQGLELGFTDTTTLDFDGNFSFDNLPGDTYTIVISSSGGLFGLAQFTAEGEINDAIGVEMELFGSETTSSSSFVTVEPTAGVALQAAELLEEHVLNPFPDVSSTSAIMYSARVSAGHGAQGSVNTRQAAMTLPQGTKSVSLAAMIESQFHIEEFFFFPQHPCRSRFPNASSLPWSFSFFLNEQLVWWGMNSYCGTAFTFTLAQPHVTDWFTRNLDVSEATRDADAELRLIASVSKTGRANAEPEVKLDAQIGTDFSLVSVLTQQPVSLTALIPVLCAGDLKNFLGVPPPNVATANKWNIEVIYRPAEAEIIDVKVFVEAPDPRSSALPPMGNLTFQKVVAPGAILLTEVGFDDTHTISENKGVEAKIWVEVMAELPDGTMVTRREFLGKDLTTKEELTVLTPLYNVGPEVGPERRYGIQDDIDPDAEDAWGTVGTFDFVTMFEFLENSMPSGEQIVFNDISLEHGGRFPLKPIPAEENDFHKKHQCGLSIDSRYFGNGGTTNTLNGTQDNDRGTARRATLEQAQGGDPIARQDIVTWILENRERMDQLAQSGEIAWMGIGDTDWNTRSLLEGLFPNDPTIPGDELTPICCDSGGNNIGPWTGPGRNVVELISGHLSHVHIERVP